ncbi:iron complex outermembrane recepter protein [Lutibacter oricola]|uniref:Iron complex outermembrane recepter protein n=1 Tax=Lutibacter oricola TaxID=762486 RepID=A0A1H3FUT2_9FLAO|nr:TonB-dependent receptor [Lutibacter oricola]SDX94711.1 iron complex outermembrane recepter protein [Lutibacter oricola]
MNIKVKIFLFTFVFIATMLSNKTFAQKEKIYNQMTLDELLDIDVVVTVSKKPEDLFETPLSTTIISKKEIENSGVTNIPEALRLSQGVIVREITPGNYDIHIRGYDDVTKNVYLTLAYNSTTLVMIDNRIVYSYLGGGTFWETFPVDLNDVERIEIVRGPASALYGPNAVTGVINIITSHAHKKGKNIVVNASLGNNKTKHTSLNVGYNWNDKTKLSFSGNFARQNRFEEEYYDFTKREYTSLDNLEMFVSPIKNFDTYEVWTYDEYQKELGAYYDEELSLKKLGGNIFFTHNYSENSNIDVAVGAQKSQSQKIGFLNLSTPLSQSKSTSYYINSKIKLNNLYAQFNINSGKDENNYKFNSYKFTNVEANLEYFKQFKNFNIRPGINYKFLSCNSPFTYNEPLSFNTLNYQFKDSPRETSSYSAFVLSEWKPISKIRLIGAVRVDKFDFNKNYFTNYEVASTYRINKNNLIRASYSKANKSPFFFDSYLNSSMVLRYQKVKDLNGEPVLITSPVNIDVKGQEDLKYPTITNFDIGWRTKFNSNLSLDLELFHSKVKNFVNPNVYYLLESAHQLSDQGEIVWTIPIVESHADVLFENYNVRAKQFGVGFTLNYEINKQFKAKLFGTYQHTDLLGNKDISFETTDTSIGAINGDKILTTYTNLTVNFTQWSDEATPSFFGGFLLNYNPNKKWNFSTNGYIYSNYKYARDNYYEITNEDNILDARTEMDINANVIWNAKTTYKINKNVMTNLTFKNILGDHREFGFADNIGASFLIGFQWQY